MFNKKIPGILILLLLVAGLIIASTPGNTPEGMVFVKGGTFLMGTDDDPATDRLPIHRVSLDSYCIGKYEVTQSEWTAVMPDNPSYFKGDKNPVEGINWFMAVEYCNAKSKKEGLTPCYSGTGNDIICNFDADGYRLPTEAEWEYAGRGGKHSRHYNYCGSNIVDEVSWYEANSGGKTLPVGLKKPNEIGIYDMSGNIWEWCWDRYDAEYYKKSPVKNPTGPTAGDNRVYRGGGCCGRLEWRRSTGRYNLPPSYSHSDMGFRIVRKYDGSIPEGMVLVEGGDFDMGSKDSSTGEGPAHSVTLRDFYIGKYEVTQEEWMDLMEDNPSYIAAAKNPVNCVSWYMAVEYCNKRSLAEGLTPCYEGSGLKTTCDFNANGYRLPTEAEWEYASRGGEKSKNFKFSGSDDPHEVGWCSPNSPRTQTQPVGLKKPNELGIYDMTGNAFEWCWDWFDTYYYQYSPSDNPIGPSFAVRRVNRSFSHYFPPQTNTARAGSKPQHAFAGFGFRVVRTAK